MESLQDSVLQLVLSLLEDSMKREYFFQVSDFKIHLLRCIADKLQNKYEIFQMKKQICRRVCDVCVLSEQGFVEGVISFRVK